MSNRGAGTLIGIIIFSIGFLAILVEMVGVHFSFLNFLNVFGRLGAFTAKILMMVFGMILIILVNNTDKPDEIEENNK